MLVIITALSKTYSLLTWGNENYPASYENSYRCITNESKTDRYGASS